MVGVSTDHWKQKQQNVSVYEACGFSEKTPYTNFGENENSVYLFVC